MKRKVVVWFRRIGLGVLLLICVMHGYIRYGIVEMPGNPYAGTPPPPNAMIRATTARLRTHVEILANEIGGRSIYNTEALDRTQAWIAAEFRRLDLEPNKQTYEVEPELVNEAIERRNRKIKERGGRNFLPLYGNHQPTKDLVNLWVEIKGRTTPERFLVVGAHYDTVTPDCPGADDNSTGIAALLEIGRRLQDKPPKLSVILAAFTCEEQPLSATDKQGSAVFVNELLTKEQRVPVGMIALETLG